MTLETYSKVEKTTKELLAHMNNMILNKEELMRIIEERIQSLQSASVDVYDPLSRIDELKNLLEEIKNYK